MNELEILKTKIESFWKWFFDAEEELKGFFAERSRTDKAMLVEMINNQVLGFGLFTWEIGPLDGDRYYFTISPNGSQQGLSISKKIMKSAPSLSDWEFYYAKPVKDWDLTFIIYDEFMIERSIDVSDWQAALKISKTNLIEIVLETPNIKHLDEDTQVRAGEIAVMKMIGEEDRINFIERIDIIDTLEKAVHGKGFPIQDLKQAFEDLI